MELITLEIISNVNTSNSNSQQLTVNYYDTQQRNSQLAEYFGDLLSPPGGEVPVELHELAERELVCADALVLLHNTKLVTDGCLVRLRVPVSYTLYRPEWTG